MPIKFAKPGEPVYLAIKRWDVQPKVIKVDQNNFREAAKNLFLNKYTFWEVPKPPSKRTIRRWRQQGRARDLKGNWCSIEQLKPLDKHLLGIE